MEAWVGVLFGVMTSPAKLPPTLLASFPFWRQCFLASLGLSVAELALFCVCYLHNDVSSPHLQKARQTDQKTSSQVTHIPRHTL